jgi:hypothetical protein
VSSYRCSFPRREKRIIDVTPDPTNSPLEMGPDQRVSGLLVVLVGALALGFFAASDVTTRQTHSKSWPRITEFDAFSAHLSFGLHALDL